MAKKPVPQEENHSADASPAEAPASAPTPVQEPKPFQPVYAGLAAVDPNAGAVIAQERNTLTRAGHRFQKRTVNLMRALGKLRY